MFNAAFEEKYIYDTYSVHRKAQIIKQYAIQYTRISIDCLNIIIL
jgi:hypothetical protein